MENFDNKIGSDRPSWHFINTQYYIYICTPFISMVVLTTKKGRSENLHHKKIVLNKKIIQGMRNIFHICLKKIDFKV